MLLHLLEPSGISNFRGNLVETVVAITLKCSVRIEQMKLSTLAVECDLGDADREKEVNAENSQKIRHLR